MQYRSIFVGIAAVALCICHTPPVWAQRHHQSQGSAMLSRAEPPSVARQDSIDTPNGYVPLGVAPLVLQMTTAAYARYTTPSLCASAAERIGAIAWRSADAQEQLLLRRSDTVTLPLSVRESVKSCDRWQTLAPRAFDIPGLVRLSLLAGQDARARVLAEQWVAQLTPRDTVARADRLVQLVLIYLSARPRTAERIAMAKYFKNVLRLQKSPVVRGRQWYVQQQLTHQARSDGDIAATMAGADTLITMLHELPTPEDRINLGALALWNDGYMALLASLLKLPTGKLNTSTLMTAGNAGFAAFWKDIETLPDSTVDRARKSPQFPKTFAQQLANIVMPNVPALVAQHWFNKPVGAENLPRPGVATVIFKMDQNCGDACYAQYAAYRRLYQEFAPKGVDFIFMMKTQGYLGSSLLIPVAAEVDSIRTYVQDRLKLPGIIGVEESHFVANKEGLKSANATLDQWPSFLLVTKTGQGLGPSAYLFDADLKMAGGEAALRAYIANQLVP